MADVYTICDKPLAGNNCPVNTGNISVYGPITDMLYVAKPLECHKSTNTNTEDHSYTV